IVRYWRTMCVDYTKKRRERGLGGGWGLRNIKLRISRKLLFSAGLITCLACKVRPSSQLTRLFAHKDDYIAAMAEELLLLSTTSPIETLARFVIAFEAVSAGKEIFDAYNEFLSLLDDPSKRDVLEKLEPAQAGDNETFRAAKELSNRFQAGLVK